MNTLDLGNGPLLIWRLDLQRHAATWDSGEGAHRKGGRWNPARFRVVYCSQDPATAILEVAAHKGFDALDTARHVMSCAEVKDLDQVHVLRPNEVPNDNWLFPGAVGGGQQTFGRNLLRQHAFLAVPSTVSRHSWNILFSPELAQGLYSLSWQEDFALDPRLNPPSNEGVDHSSSSDD